MDIAFYHLLTTPLERALPKILEKIYASPMRALVVCDSVERLNALNSTLWTFSPTAFLPHGFEGDPLDHPIWLSLTSENKNNADVLVVANESRVSPDMGYKRTLDFFDGNNEDSVQKARARFKDYKDAGHTLTYWRQNIGGGWDRV